MNTARGDLACGGTYRLSALLALRERQVGAGRLALADALARSSAAQSAHERAQRDYEEALALQRDHERRCGSEAGSAGDYQHQQRYLGVLVAKVNDMARIRQEAGHEARRCAAMIRRRQDLLAELEANLGAVQLHKARWEQQVRRDSERRLEEELHDMVAARWRRES